MWFPKRLNADAIFCVPVLRINPITVFLSAAIACGPWPKRVWLASSPRVTSRT
jgi:hypothetical protein